MLDKLAKSKKEEEKKRAKAAGEKPKKVGKPDVLKSLREKVFTSIAKKVKFHFDNSFVASGKIKVGSEDWEFERCLIQVQLHFLDADVRDTEMSSKKKKEVAKTAKELHEKVGTHFELRFRYIEDPESDPGPPNPQWKADPYREEPPTEEKWVEETKYESVERDPLLKEIDSELSSYEFLTDTANPAKAKEALDAIDKAAAKWLTSGPGAEANPSDAVEWRKNWVLALRDTVKQRKEYLDRAKKSRELQVNWKTDAAFDDVVVEHFPSMLGVYKNAFRVTPDDLLPLVKKLITTNPKVAKL
jgi:hypothetical protein